MLPESLISSARDAAELPHATIAAEGLRRREWPTILQILDTCPLFRPREQWAMWRAFLAAAWGLPMTSAEQAFYGACTGRLEQPRERATEADCIVGRRGGKALAIDTPILTTKGWRTVGGLAIGDEVYGPDGVPTKVVATTDVMRARPCYDVAFNGGEVIRADAEHEWLVFDKQYRKNSRRRNPVPRTRRGAWKRIPLGPKIRTTAALAQTTYCSDRMMSHGYRGRESEWAVPRAKALQYATAQLPMAPYLLGLWLGDGSSKAGEITSADPENAERIQALGYRMAVPRAKVGTKALTYGIYGLLATLRLLEIYKNKHVPRRYLMADENQRLELLRGLMDSDGYVDAGGKLLFEVTNKNLADGTLELIRGLGWPASLSERPARLYGVDCGRRYSVHFQADKSVFRLARRAERQRQRELPYRYIRSVTPAPASDVRCIQVAREDGLYTAGRSRIVTHNSRIIALSAIHLATERDVGAYLAAGEIASIPVISQDRAEAGTVMGYIRALCELPPYNALLAGEPTADRVRLNVAGYTVDIVIRVASYRAVRSYTVIGAVLDEVAFWRSDEAGSANPDTEVLRALRPAAATVPGSMILKVSSPFARSGVLWRDYREHWAKPGPHLVWKAPTLLMHPDAGPLREEIERAYRDDPVSAAAEYGAEFRTDLAGLITEDALAGIVEPRGTLEPMPGVTYFGFVDVSGGSADSFAIAIAHWEPPAKGDDGNAIGEGRSVVDLVWEQIAPFDPEVTTAEAARILKRYSIVNVTGDRYGGLWPETRFRANGIGYLPSENDKSALFLHFAALANARRTAIPAHPRLKAQLLALDRRAWASGKETVDHPRGGHDDLANACAGAAVEADQRRIPPRKIIAEPTTLAEMRVKEFHDWVQKRVKEHAREQRETDGGTNMGIM